MPRIAVDYDEDFYAWTVEQARLLRSGELSAIDAANIAEEIESMGRSDRRELKSRLIVLLDHLLKWRHQPDLCTKISRAFALLSRRSWIRLTTLHANVRQKK